MGNKHAFLSASSAYRWISCPPSIVLSQNYEEKASDYAIEGSSAHALCEYKLLSLLGKETNDPRENLDFYNEEMEECLESYVAYISELMEYAKKDTKDIIVFAEQHVDFSRWVPEGFGTTDCLIIADKTLTICDLKYGKGLLIDADHNPQLMCYALGAYEMFSPLYDIERIKMVIFQPRRDNLSTFEMTVEDFTCLGRKNTKA